MSRTFTLSLLAVLAATLIGAAAPAGTIDWTMTPIAPSAGDTLKIAVAGASSFPVVVEFYVDGLVVFTHTFEEPGIVDFTIPADKAGTDWAIDLESDDATDSDNGLL